MQDEKEKREAKGLWGGRIKEEVKQSVERSVAFLVFPKKGRPGRDFAVGNSRAAKPFFALSDLSRLFAPHGQIGRLSRRWPVGLEISKVHR